MCKILLVEDNQVLADGVVRFLATHFSADTIQTAGSGKQCLMKLKQAEFSLVLLDYRLPDIGGAELCRVILDSNPGIKIIALTGMIGITAVNEMIKAGASGYILKTSIPDELIDGINAVMRGEKYISDGLV